MPRSLDVILRGEMVERAKAGDKCIFTGTFVVVPDVSQLGLPGGNKAEIQREAFRSNATTGGVGGNGVTGLKSLGVRDLQYKTAFLACMVHGADGRVSWSVPKLNRVLFFYAGLRMVQIYEAKKNTAKRAVLHSFNL